jgi:hypothetical protein
MINRGKGMLITRGLMMKNKMIMGMFGKSDSGAHLVYEEAIREGYNA